jgi:hypothetical protein
VPVGVVELRICQANYFKAGLEEQCLGPTDTLTVA